MAKKSVKRRSRPPSSKKRATARVLDKRPEVDIDAAIAELPFRVEPDIRWMLVPLELLKLDPDNANQHPPDSIPALADSYRDHGQQKPIVVDRDGVIRAGNGQYLAAQHLGARYIAALISEHASASRSNAIRYGLADNRTAELSTFDYSKVRELMRELAQEEAAAIERLGWDAKSVAALIGDYEPPSTPPRNQSGGGGGSSLEPVVIAFTKTQHETILELAGEENAKDLARWIVETLSEALSE